MPTVVTFGEIMLRLCPPGFTRFVQTTRPFKLGMPLPLELLWSPLWALLAPLLALAIPLACSYLDRFDREQRFTVGYHVTAIKG